MGYKLTLEEKLKVAEYARSKERAAHPGAAITITVGDEVGTEGLVPITVVRITEIEMPGDLLPSKI